jgi:hypothetical protein
VRRRAASAQAAVMRAVNIPQPSGHSCCLL